MNKTRRNLLILGVSAPVITSAYYIGDHFLSRKNRYIRWVLRNTPTSLIQYIDEDQDYSSIDLPHALLYDTDGNELFNFAEYYPENWRLQVTQDFANNSTHVLTNGLVIAKSEFYALLNYKQNK